MPMSGAELPPSVVAPGWSLSGPPGGPCVVLLHGVFFGRRSWRLQADALVPAWRTLSIDLPGHGDLRDVPFSLPAARDHVLDTLDAAGIDRAILVGWSLGGFVAMEVAATRPERVAGLVLTGATMEPRRFLGGPGRIATRLLGHAPAGPSAAVVLMVMRLLYGSRVAAMLRTTDPTIPQGMRALSTLPSDGFLERVARYPGRVLLLNGAGDHLVRAGLDRFLRATRDGSTVVVPRAGHMAPLEAPAAVTSAIAGFVRGVAGSKDARV
jgi:pimeloyl-ACP methyl ester carboxylesterase